MNFLFYFFYYKILKSSCRYVLEEFVLLNQMKQNWVIGVLYDKTKEIFYLKI